MDRKELFKRWALSYTEPSLFYLPLKCKQEDGYIVISARSHSRYAGGSFRITYQIGDKRSIFYPGAYTTTGSIFMDGNEIAKYTGSGFSNQGQLVSRTVTYLIPANCGVYSVDFSFSRYPTWSHEEFIRQRRYSNASTVIYYMKRNNTVWSKSFSDPIEPIDLGGGALSYGSWHAFSFDAETGEFI